MQSKTSTSLWMLGLCTLVGTLVACSKLSAQETSLEMETPLRDKTLVAWVAPANLTQRGGSVLTIEDRGDRFDAIVFAELAEKKWMAGSEFFRRTGSDWSKVAEEAATPDELVQIALVYSGTNVALYRNSELLNTYTMPNPPAEFGPYATIGIGKRHQRQAGEARFAGSVDDARIYASALTQQQIRELKPNVESSIRPWSWWTFDDGEAKDRTGRFLISELRGNAKVEKGRLWLDGVTGDFVCKTGRSIPFVTETPARPDKVPADWLTFHLAHPGPGTAMPGDPNCAFYWQGRYHLHYIYTHQDGFSFAHLSSRDLVHWKWHPTVLTPPKTGHGMFSGTGFFTKEGRPAIIYHGEGSGRNQVAIALDDDLDRWSDPIAVEPSVAPEQDGSKIANLDPDAWIDGDFYYALSGGSPGSGKPPTLFRSDDLKRWKYLGLFLTKDMPDVKKDEDISCPNFFKIGNKDMLLCISHTLGCRYYLGAWKDEKFTPEFHARMNWHEWDFFAPESLLTADGRRVMWAWCNLGYPQSGIQSLPRELSLPSDGVLRIKPLTELASLRGKERVAKEVKLRNEARVVEAIHGDAVEVEARFTQVTANSFGLSLHTDEKGSGGIDIQIEPKKKQLSLGDVHVPFDPAGDREFVLRVYVDKNVIEVFVNDRQAAVVSHRYEAGRLHAACFAREGDAVMNATAWDLQSIYQAPASLAK